MIASAQSSQPAGAPKNTALLAAIAYLSCSSSLVLTNKFVFSHETFNFPWTTLAVQSLVVVALLSTYQLWRGGTTFNPDLLRQLLLPCSLFTLYLFTNARALRHLSLPILSVIKSLAPVSIALVERVLYGDALSLPVMASMLLIVAANTVAMLHRPADESNAGFGWAALNIVVNVAYVLSLRACLSSSFSPVEKTLHSNMIATVMMLPLSVANREMRSFFFYLADANRMLLSMFALSCVLAAAIGASIFWLVEQTSGSTLSFVGACNKFPVVVLGAMLFHTRISKVTWASVMVGVLGGVLFAVAKALEKKDVGVRADCEGEAEANGEGAEKAGLVLEGETEKGRE